MARRPVILAAGALQDLSDMRTYYRREAGPAVAARMTMRMRRALRSIAANPESGSRRDDMNEGVRFRVVKPYLIYFDAQPSRVVILRILHAARDRDALMRPDQD